MITRKLGKIVLGKATPAQLILACVLASMLGFMPGFFQAGGLIVALVLLLVVLNANLALAAIVAVIAKVLSYLLLPASFYLGAALLEGPTQPLFKAMINAPVLALFGFGYYATTGGLVIGLLLGLLSGLVVVKAVRTIREKMAGLQSDSPSYQKWASKWWVKLLSFVLLGKGKVDFAKLAAAKGKMIRPAGVAAAAVVIALLVVVDLFFAGPIVTYALQRGLEQANGATVDLGSAEVDLAHGKMIVHQLALADPNHLDTNLFQAKTLTIDIDTADLLTKRLTLDNVTVIDAVQGAKRKTPGHLIGHAPTPTPQTVPPKAGQKTLGDYLKDAKTWKDRLAQIKRWLDTLQSARSAAPSASTKAPSSTGPTYMQRLAQRAAQLGYANVRASDLVTKTPSFTVRKLVADGIRTAAFKHETIDLHASNLSTQPALMNQPAQIQITSSKGTLLAKVSLAGAAKGASAGTMDRLQFAYHGLPVDTVTKQLKLGGRKPVILGGTMNLAMDGRFTPTDLDLPLKVTLHHTTVNIPGAGSTKVETLSLPIALAGPMDNPKITVSQKQLAAALKQAGVQMLATKAKGEASKQIEKATGKLSKKIGGQAAKQIGQAGGKILNGLFGGHKKNKKHSH